MLYVICTVTGEHRIYEEGEYLETWHEILVSADEDGWVSRTSCVRNLPIQKGMLCDVEYRDGDKFYNVKANEDIVASDWKIDGSNGDIVAYRPIFDTENAPVEWNGIGYPPVGTICDIEFSKEIVGKILAYGKHGEEDAVLVCEMENGRESEMFGLLCSHVYFTPIQSDKEKVIDEMIAIWYREGNCNMREFARVLYHEGFRRG